MKDEQDAQTAYASLVSETNNSLEANSKEIVNKCEEGAGRQAAHQHDARPASCCLRERSLGRRRFQL